MHGSACSGLLVLSFLALPPGVLCGQADRTDRSFKVAPDSPITAPHPVPAPEPNPIQPQPWRPVMPPGTFGLNHFARAAGMIFSGEVTSVAYAPAMDGQTIETLAITFHVENAIRGTTGGKSRVSLSDFTQAVRQAGEEESPQRTRR